MNVRREYDSWYYRQRGTMWMSGGSTTVGIASRGESGECQEWVHQLVVQAERNYMNVRREYISWWYRQRGTRW
jgi:hypothetical protein